MLFLGVDPGLTTTGLGIIEKAKNGTTSAVDWVTIETSPSLPLEQRLFELSRDAEEYLKGFEIEAAGVEQVFFAVNKRSAIDVAHARGVLLRTLAARAIPVLSVTPLQLKTAITGDGKADKKQIQWMVMRSLNLAEPPSPADAADALALALFAAQRHPGL